MPQLQKSIALMILIIVGIPFLVFGQREEWSCFFPLKSTRDEIERVLGKPDKYFISYGTYETKSAKYSVWYASGHCSGNVEGRDWNVSAGRMTNVTISPKQINIINDYVSNLQDFRRQESPGGYSRFLYLSKDETLIYKTIRKSDSSEIIETISIEPGKSKENLLCSEKKK